MAAAAPVVHPWYEAWLTTIAGRLVYRRAIKMAISTASEPELTNRPPPKRSDPLIVSVTSSSAALALPSKDSSSQTKSNPSTASWSAARIRSFPCPTPTHMY